MAKFNVLLYTYTYIIVTIGIKRMINFNNHMCSDRQCTVHSSKAAHAVTNDMINYTSCNMSTSLSSRFVLAASPPPPLSLALSPASSMAAYS